jgi:type IV secretion system protein VirB4
MKKSKPQDTRKLAAADPAAGDRLPYAWHVNDHTVATREGDLVQMVALEGYPFETADTDTLNQLASTRDTIFRGIASSQLILYCHVVRRRVVADLSLQQPEGVAREIDQKWRQQLSERRLFVNDIVLTLVRRPAKGKVGLLERLSRKFRGLKTASVEDDAALGRDLRELDAARVNLMAALGRYGPRQLGQYENNVGEMRCMMMEHLSALYNGESQPVLVPQGDLGHYLPYKRVSFGMDTLELRGSVHEGNRLGAIISIKDYPAATAPGMLDNVLRLPHELTLSESFAFVDRQIADERMSMSLRRLRAASDETLTLKQGLMSARDDLAAGNAAYGEHHMTIHVRAKTLDALDRAVADVQSALADTGAIAVREDLNLEAAFWAQFPGNAEFIARRAMISTSNLSGLMSLHSFPAGNVAGGPWGEPLTVLETTSSTPYFFNLHHGDLGNFTLIGPSGSGKTVVLNFLVAQAQKFAPRTFFFDKDRGAEIFIRAIGGHYDVLRPGTPSGFNPLALSDTPENRAFLRSWLSLLGAPQQGPLSNEDAALIADAVDANFDQPVEYRRLRYFVELLSGAIRPQRGDLASRLAPWHSAGEYAWLFDNAQDRLDINEATIGFDMTALLDNRVLRTPAMLYLFHRADERLDGRPSMIVIDEGWKALDDEIFARQLKDWMKTVRKRGGVVGFATQSAADALDSKIASTIIEQAATQMFMPNPKAQARDYIDGFGLTAHEFELVRGLPDHLRCVLIKQANMSVVARLDMSGMPEVLTILSGREKSVRHMDSLRAEHGDDPAEWLPQLVNAAKKGPRALWERDAA